MSKKKYQLVDFVSQQPVSPSNLIFTGQSGPWSVQLDLPALRAKIKPATYRKTPISFEKYFPFLPMQKKSSLINLHGGPTPLLKSHHFSEQFAIDLFFKMEAKNPTGSFKDRGSMTDVGMAQEFSARGIVVASTGNMAASVACYAAQTEMPCYIFVPVGVPIAKLAQVIAFGGKIVQVQGTFNDAVRLAEYMASTRDFYLAGDYAFRLEGQKTAAFELLDQLKYDVPDYVIVPIGCGTNLGAYGKAFDEYKAVGLIKKIPKIIGVEATGADAVVHSFEKNLADIIPKKDMRTIASAIAIADPIDGLKALAAIRNSNGRAIAVSDEEMLQAQHLLCVKESLFVETASAATIAALIKLAKVENLKNKSVVCILTGDGLKEASTFLNNIKTPPIISADKTALDDLFK